MSWMYRLLKKPFFGRFMVKWKNPLSNDQQAEWQSLQVKSKSGGVIKALFARQTNGRAKATIVMGHPMGKEAKAYYIKNGYCEMLRSSGYNVCVFDFNSFGESTHGSFSFDEDIIAVGKEVLKITPGLPIGYLGISLGGQMAVIALTSPENMFQFAVIESAATSLDEFWVNIPLAYFFLQILNRLMPLFRKRMLMIERIKDIKNVKALLFIYSETDHLTPVDMGKRFIQQSPVTAKLFTICNAPHAAIVKSAYKHSYFNAITAFFDAAISIPG